MLVCPRLGYNIHCIIIMSVMMQRKTLKWWLVQEIYYKNVQLYKLRGHDYHKLIILGIGNTVFVMGKYIDSWMFWMSMPLDWCVYSYQSNSICIFGAFFSHHLHSILFAPFDFGDIYLNPWSLSTNAMDKILELLTEIIADGLDFLKSNGYGVLLFLLLPLFSSFFCVFFVFLNEC